MSFYHAKLGAIALALSSSVVALAADAHPKSDQAGSGEEVTQREEIAGIGGFFFLADDTATLSAWYEKHFGIKRVPTSYDEEPWAQEAGPTVFAPFPKPGQPMIPKGKTWMINFRVTDLNAMVAQLTADGVEVTVDPTTYPNGRFATLLDPEGNPIQLWESAVPK